MKTLVYITLLLITVFSCIKKPENNGLGGYIDDEEYFNEFVSDKNDTNKVELELEIDSLVNDTAFIDFSNHLIDLLDENKLIEFSNQFHPEKGCTFVPYTFMVEEDLNFNPTSFQKELNNKKKLHWGMYDGSGEPIDLTVKNYFKQFVYDVDFKNNSTDIHISKDLTYSNSLNNISEFYPEADYIEFYFEGTTEFEGMDWSSLIFYIEKHENTYYIVAVVHNQWTI